MKVYIGVWCMGTFGSLPEWFQQDGWSMYEVTPENFTEDMGYESDTAQVISDMSIGGSWMSEHYGTSHQVFCIDINKADVLEWMKAKAKQLAIENSYDDTIFAEVEKHFN